ncbi:hypothetical protein LVB77_10255 [Lysobacter sp. 5GHs7-4]|uniref:hypothetical protein n=1 Tax=Lysobacter sp. 5GHs7-4 TaxID=2904253 RepID=UPI001E627AF8|nr:hypothetical protein [Lysobacter sp. 5GHs7-4]UHQ25023.1 hypothetical protein LVB77_10255 [Lysobacter sp. 5GHs7-4]
MSLGKTMRVAVLACALWVWPATSALAQSGQGERYQPRSERGRLAAGLVLRWAGHVQQVYGTAPQRWAQGMAPTFARAPLANLRRAAAMTDYDAMMAAASEPYAHRSAPDAARAPSPTTTAALSSERLLYTMLTPCRLADTRTVARRMSAGESRSFSLQSLTAQGGAQNGCGIPTDASAVTLNITVINPDVAGYLTVFPTGGTRPLASSLNYRVGDVVANEIIARLGGDPWPTYSVYSYAGADLVIDVAGYFSAAKSEPLDCTQVESALVAVNPGGTASAVTPACPAGYTGTGGGCTVAGAYPSIDEVYFHGFGAQANGGYACHARNRGGVARNVRAEAMCCRLPGR